MSDYSALGDDAVSDGGRDGGRDRNVSTGTVLPRMPSLTEKSAPRSQAFQDGRSNTMQSTSSLARPENTNRPSAASVRDMNHSRRHSSVDYGKHPTTANASSSPSRQSHRKQPSFDKTWSPGTPQTTTNGRAVSSAHSHTQSSGSIQIDPETRGLALQTTSNDLDRGYFSGGEVENRNRKNVLTKKGYSGTDNSRNSSYMTETGKPSGPPKTLGKVASNESMREPVPTIVSQAASHYYGTNKNLTLRTASNPQFATKSATTKEPLSPTVTKLEYNNSPSLTAIVTSPPFAESETSSLNPTPSPASHSFTFLSNNKSRATGARAASDAITSNEKAMAAAPAERVPSTVKESSITSPTRASSSTTPSSLDMQTSEMNSRISGGS
ncbi:hypothetical protein LTR28_008784, partial [Elasticomyces elasticus]